MSRRATLHIDSLAALGDGVGHLDGRVVFVPGTAPGDTVEIELGDPTKCPARGRVTKRVESSPERVTPSCPHVEACGGCPWMHLSPKAQVEAKARLFEEALARIGGVSPDALTVNALIASPSPLGYRRRATLHLEGGRLGYRAAASHDLVEVSGCALLDPMLEASLPGLRAALEREGAPPRCTDIALACDERHVTAAFFVGAASDATVERVERIRRAARLDGAVVVPEGGRGQAIGDAVLSHPAPGAEGVVLHARADLFAQANAPANALLVGEALRLLGKAGPGDELLELYCGAGNFTFAAARLGWTVTAVEGSADAVELARRSARQARVQGVRFVQDDALKAAQALGREGRRFAALLLDPPRTGARGIAEVARLSQARRVVYVSCDPATLARDVKDLRAAGFEPREATPIDMFPQTFHLEGVVQLVRS